MHCEPVGPVNLQQFNLVTILLNKYLHSIDVNDLKNYIFIQNFKEKYILHLNKICFRHMNC